MVISRLKMRVESRESLNNCLALIKACNNAKDLCRVHAEILRFGFLYGNKGPIIATTLISVYAKCCLFSKARELLENLPMQDVIPWNALIAGYVQQGHCHEAIRCFERMKQEGHVPNGVTLICILNACGLARDRCKGKQIHEEIVRKGYLIMLENKKRDDVVVLGTSLVGMYVKWGDMVEARRALEGLHLRNVVTWTSVVVGYTQQRHCYAALEASARMQAESFVPNMVTLVSLLKASSSIGDIYKGKQLHVIGSFLVEKRKKADNKEIVVFGSALIAMYAECGVLSEAQRVLDEICTHDVVSWNALISGYVHWDQARKAIFSFERMRMQGILPDAFSFACVLNACAETEDIDKGKQIHEEIMMNEKRMLEKDVVLGNALVDMYAKCGTLKVAEKVLKELKVRNVASWNALIVGYVRHRWYHEAFDCFENLSNKVSLLEPDAVTFLCILQACGDVGFIHKGKQIHKEIVLVGFLKNNVNLGNALVNMYAQCNMLVVAHQVLEELPLRDVASWNTLMSAYARKGQIHQALYCFVRMQSEGLCPNKVTFTSVLSGFGHSGLSKEAETFFSYMTERYGVIPSIQHYSCMMVVFGCVGDFNLAMTMMKSRPSSGDLARYVALLGACNKWGNVKIGRLVFDLVLQLGNQSTASDLLQTTYRFSPN